MNRAAVCRHIEEVGMVPVLRLPSQELVIRAVEAILAAGVSVFEITMTVPRAVELIRSLVDRFGERAVVGAGTVLSAENARACMDAGAQFIVSPGLDLPTIEAAHERDVPIMPGALTPTEVITAWKAGADMVKIFPCSAVGGAKYLKALKGPLPQVKMLPTGGVNLTTVRGIAQTGVNVISVGALTHSVSVLDIGLDA